MTARKYTGNTDGIAGRRPGTDHMVSKVQTLTGGALWNDGTWTVRPMRGYPSGDPKYVSVHATGRAMDLSRRKTSKRPGSSRTYLLACVDWFVRNADALGLEMLCDYGYAGPQRNGAPGAGRVWKCDRPTENGGWRTAKPGLIDGAPGGQWIHLELDPKHADSAALIDAAFSEAAAGGDPFPLPADHPVPPAPVPDGPPPYPGKALKRGSKGPAVRRVQAVVGATVDGIYGPKTEQHVISFQNSRPPLVADGIVGPLTWSALFGTQKDLT